MASSTARRAPLVLLPLLLAALTACAGTSPSASPASTATLSASANGTPGAPGTAAPPATPSAPPGVRSSPSRGVTELTLVLADGEVTGDSPLAELRVGEPARLSVTSDVADELHVHGVDETLELAPGQTEVLEFTMRSPGRFEVELHDARRVLTRLQVR